ncbi:MAG: type II toxin-antitoxin system VapC family toxin [Gammaproteobacteria bacterium]
MNSKVIVDTGPLIAFLNAKDNYHAWAKYQLSKIKPPLMTCEAVLAEVCFLLSKYRTSCDALFELVQRKLIVTPFLLKDEIPAIKKLMTRYQDVPMSFADACLVRMSEQYSNSTVLTLDTDFHVYRRHSRQVISTLMPVEV